MKRTDVTIGQLSAKASVKVETIRYYEKIGLMPKPLRSAGRQRMYDHDHIRRLNFIRRARELGFPLNDIRVLLGLEDHAPSCSEVHTITRHHLGVVKQKIADLNRLKRTLTEIAEQCERTETPDCPVIDALFGR